MTRRKKIALIIIGIFIALIIVTVIILNNDKNPANDIDRNLPGLKPRIPTASKDNPLIEKIFEINSELLVTANTDSAFAIIDTLERGYIAGHYYPLEINSNYTTPHTFNITLRRNNTIVMLDGKEIEVDIPARKLELYLDGKRHNANCNNMRRVTLSIKPYNKPTFHATNDQRYKKAIYDVDIKQNIRYANAQGFWCSMIDKENKGYGEILMQSFKKIRKIKDLDLEMDLYTPIDSLNTPHPFLLFIHGGGFYLGDKSDTTTMIICKHFASMGYITASINYRMGFLPSRKEIERTEYMALQDAHAAMRYILATDSNHTINQNQLFLGGSSAGSMIALNLAFMTNNDKPSIATGKKRNRRFPDLGSIESSGNEYTNVFSFRAIANLWGAMSDLDLMKGSKAEIISFHGDADNIVPYDFGYPFSDISERLGKRLVGAMFGSSAIHKRALRIGLRSELITFHGLSHAPQFNPDHTLHQENMDIILTRMTDFFYQTLVPIKPHIVPNSSNIREYMLIGGELSNIEWKIEGGFFVNLNNTSVKVVWLSDAPKHTLIATAHHQSGLDFTVDYSPTEFVNTKEAIS